MDYFRYWCSSICDRLFSGTSQPTNDQKERMVHRDTNLGELIRDLTVLNVPTQCTSRGDLKRKMCMFCVSTSRRFYSGGIGCFYCIQY